MHDHSIVHSAASSARYLEAAGFAYKPALSPDIWAYLENLLGGAGGPGPKFAPMPDKQVAEIVATGEAMMLRDLVEMHRRTGRIERVAAVVSLPYVVGTDAVTPLADADPDRVLRLVENPGEAGERLVHLVPIQAGRMPCTRTITVSGGLYADGHTAGLLALAPGDHRDGRATDSDHVAYLALPQEIRGLARAMDERAEDITAVTHADVQAMLARVREILG